MTGETAKTMVGRLLTAFLLVSVGVAIGKELAGRDLHAPAGPTDGASGTKVVVYYMHAAPCPLCTSVEEAAKAVVREDFADAVSSGRMEFVSVDFVDPANAALAERYNVGGNMVVAVRFEAGRETARVRLDETLELASEPEKLMTYLRDGIRGVLEGVGR